MRDAGWEISLQSSAITRKIILLSLLRRPHPFRREWPATHTRTRNSQVSCVMLLFRSKPDRYRPAIAEAQFRDVLRKPNVARELFLPAEHAWWDGGKYTLGRWISETPPPVNTGVRLQEPRSPSPGLLPERDTQNDLVTLIESIVELRKVPELASVVLSTETLVGKQQGTIVGKRLLFGLFCPGDGRFRSEESAATECHRVIRKAIVRAGYIVEHPKAPYDPTSGFPGLIEWARTVRLRRFKRRRRTEIGRAHV